MLQSRGAMLRIMEQSPFFRITATEVWRWCGPVSMVSRAECITSLLAAIFLKPSAAEISICAQVASGGHFPEAFGSPRLEEDGRRETVRLRNSEEQKLEMQNQIKFLQRVLADVGHIEAQTVRTLWRPVELHEWKTSDRVYTTLAAAISGPGATDQTFESEAVCPDKKNLVMFGVYELIMILRIITAADLLTLEQRNISDFTRDTTLLLNKSPGGGELQNNQLRAVSEKLLSQEKECAGLKTELELITDEYQSCQRKLKQCREELKGLSRQKPQRRCCFLMPVFIVMLAVATALFFSSHIQY
ncbi:unnamed protein product [Ranitomeya imitator]|uniref:Coiled-coil domain-containing protein 167 n=1 Tax=Ranitomeya imitator TaxID=111125 RepID=A0ABN9LY87_9NEOB|nr:unnamed protein product [Ranitomeya imitator]